MWNFGWVVFEMVVGRSPDMDKLSSLVKQSNGRFPDLDKLATECTRGIVPGGRFEIFQKFPHLRELVTKCIMIIPDSRPEILEAGSVLEEYFQMSPKSKSSS